MYYAAMQTDLYTKAVLTTIAACLLCMVFRDQPIIPAAHAQTVENKVMDVNLVRVNGQLVSASYGSQAAVPVIVVNK